MSEKVSESYEINSHDPEIHVINVILEVLERHLGIPEELNHGEHREQKNKTQARCLEYVLKRVKP